jgi:hypothetical protein
VIPPKISILPMAWQKRSLAGFSILNEERFRQLQGEQMAELMRRG